MIELYQILFVPVFVDVVFLMFMASVFTARTVARFDLKLLSQRLGVNIVSVPSFQ